jgi:hypothetical protein
MAVMEIQATGMGMQDGDGAGVALKLPVVAGKGVDGVPATASQQIIQGALLLPGQRPELLGQGEGQQKILGRHLLL